MKTLLVCLLLLAIIQLSQAFDYNETESMHLRGNSLRGSHAIAALTMNSIYYIFGRGTDNKIYRNQLSTSSTSAWGSWTKITDEIFLGPPTAVSWAAGRIDVFAIDINYRLRHCKYTGTWDTTWADLGGPYLETVRAVSRNINALDVFVLDIGQQGYVVSFSGSSWVTTSLGPKVLDTPIVPVSWGTNRIDAYALSIGQLYTLSWTPQQGWSSWALISAPSLTLFGTPAVTSQYNGKINVFTLEQQASLRHYDLQADGFWNVQTLNGKFTSDLSLVSWGPDRLDLFGMGTDSELYWRTWNGVSWSSNIKIVGQFGSAPTATCGQIGEMAVFGVASYNNRVYWKKYNPATNSWSIDTGVSTQTFFR